MKATVNKEKILESLENYDASKVKAIITDAENLSAMAQEIDPKKQGALVQEITLALKNTIRANKLTALSAPAIGYPYRIFCVSFNKGADIRTFVNPIIAGADGMTLSRETCTSIPDKTYIRIRNSKITLLYMSPLGKPESREIAGYSAYVIQHEVDHINGLLLSDVGLEIDEMYDKATDEERLEVINAYLDALDIKQKQLETEIKNDTELKKINDAIDFMTAANNGEVETEFVTISKEEAEKIKEHAKNNSGGDEDSTQPKKRGRKPKNIEVNGDKENANSNKA